MERLSLSTQVALQPVPMFGRAHQIVTLGSCFSEHIGLKLQAYKWKALVNPFGTLFHPLALFRLLELCLKSQALPDSEFVQHDGAWFHYALPSSFFGKSPEEVQERFLQVSAELRASLQAADVSLFLTLGTAQVFMEKTSGAIVANCHKQTAAKFEKRLLTLTEIDEAWSRLLTLLPKQASIVWTLSPVRHVREGLEGNCVSKSLLRLWIHQQLSRPAPGAWYFPAYEIMLDELRDYRYYGSDFIHPNELAVEYLWKIFITFFSDSKAQEFCRIWERILLRIKHRPLREGAPSTLQFWRETVAMLNSLEGVDVSEELAWLNRKCNASMGETLV